MARCDEMREGEIYCCEQCGLEIEIIEECDHEDGDEADEVCSVDEFMCCGQPMVQKED